MSTTRTTQTIASALAVTLGGGALVAFAPATHAASAPVKSTTQLVVSPDPSEYGEAVTAAATVTTPGATPAGDVTFVVKGVSTTVEVEDGKALLELAQPVAGEHPVSATFTPADPTVADGSAAEPVTLDVAKAETRSRLRIRHLPRRTEVTVKVSGEHETVATGKVKLVLRKLGDEDFIVKRFGRLGKGSRGLNLGQLDKGRYKVLVKYRGDANHERSTKARTFGFHRG